MASTFFYDAVVSSLRFFLAKSDRVFFPFPKHIRIESTNACNSRCVMCPRARMKRPVGTMGFELFRQIVDSLPSGPRVIHLHNFGEPLLDKAIVDKIRYCASKGYATRVFTNLNMLDEETAAALVDSGLDDLKVSVDACTKEEYESIRKGLSFETLVANIAALMSARRACGKTTPRVSILGVDLDGNPEKRGRFIAFWQGKADRVLVTKRHNWAGVGSGKGATRPRKLPCLRLWRTATILWNGDVVPCCMDYDAEAILGNVSERPLKEILALEPAKKLRRAHKDGRMDEIPLCRACELRR